MAMIGANSVVTRDIPPFAVAAGNPARVLHYRFDQGVIESLERIRWWDLDFKTLFDNASRMQSLSTEAFIEYFGQFGPEHYVDDRRNFVFSVINQRHDIQCIGCDIDGEFRPTESLNSVLQFYVNQIKPPLPQVFYQVPDILSYQER